VETRAADNGWRGGGLAAVFDDLSHNLGGFREVIDHGAFRKVLASKPDVRALFNHDANYLLGRTTAGTLRLKEVGKGLDYEFDAPATSYAADLRVLMERGDLNQSRSRSGCLAAAIRGRRTRRRVS
jgi:HK97 family phage prohead protease